MINHKPLNNQDSNQESLENTKKALEAAREYYSSGIGDDKYAKYRTDTWLKNSGFYAGMICAQARIAELEKENKRLKATNWVLKDSQLRTYDGMAQKADKYDALVKTVERFRIGLEYYAHPDHYEERITLCGLRGPGVLTDGGRLAREALAAGGGELE